MNGAMSNKTSIDYTSNIHEGSRGIMGRNSPAALLDMLAEVASRTLHSEKKEMKSLLASQCKPKTDFTKRKSHELCFTVEQLLSMPASQLVKQFSIFTSDELKRQYSYTCALVNGCEQKYTSFASEGRARMSIKAHLAEHLEYLKSNKQAYDTFTAKAIKHKSSKVNLQNKKIRLQQSKKPQETLNKENKNVIVEKSTNYLRKILLTDMSFKEFEKQKAIEKTKSLKEFYNSEVTDPDQIDVKVLGDHSYFERLKDEPPCEKTKSSSNVGLDSSPRKENIVLMVVGTDSVHMKEYSHIKDEISENLDQHGPQTYLSEIPWTEQTCSKNMEITTTSKPKGKAKFIGTSKEERELALAFMERIKKKGNPTGSNLQCHICDPPRSFTAPTTLVSHYRSHAGIKPYECRICRAVFTRRHSLKYHMLIHQNQTRFTCADCGKKFRHPSHFREHRRRHTGEAPFGCDDCGQRFKTRNTYKRHLKTRHGKVLTTTGELLCLSEEDFQKVRTNRKRKVEYNDTNHITDEDIIAAKTIMDYQDSTNQQETNNDTINQNYNDTENWKTAGTIQIINKCFGNYEVYSEPDLNKTDHTRTDISIDNKNSDSEKSNMKKESLYNIRNNLLQLQNSTCNNSKVIIDKKNHDLCTGSIQNKLEDICDSVDERHSYIKLNYNNEFCEMDEQSSYRENIEYMQSQITDDIHLTEGNEKNCVKDILNDQIDRQNTAYLLNAQETEIEPIGTNINYTNRNQRQQYDSKIFVPQDCTEYDKLKKYTSMVGSVSLQETEDKVTISENTNSIEEINMLQTGNEFLDKNVIQREDELPNIKNKLQTLSQDIIIDKYECITSDLHEQMIDFSKTTHKTLSDESKQHIYLHTDSLNNVIVENKCLKVLPQEFTLCYEQNQSKIQLTECRNVMIFNKHAQAVDIVQNGKQNTILLLSNDSLKSGILQVSQNNFTIDEMKDQILDKSK